MIIATTDGLFEVWNDNISSLDRVVIACKTVEPLWGIVTSIQLAGVSEDDPKTVKTTNIEHHLEKDYYLLKVDRTTFNIWFAFEINSYLKYGEGEFEVAIENEDHRSTIEEIRNKLYE